MIDLYYWTTPNGHKITIFLEETGLPYKIFPINIGKGEQFQPHFLKVSPNNRIPAIVDHEPKGGGAPISVFETGAILFYLGEKTGQFLPTEPHKRYDVMQWLFWQMGGLGPMAGQNNHFRNYAVEKLPYAIKRYEDETNRLYGVMNKRLADRPFLGGEYSIADMAAIRGSCRGSARARSSPTSRISSAGSRRSKRARPSSAPTRRRRRSIRTPAASVPPRSARFCSARPLPW